MTRRKREIIGLTNERDFPHLVELTFPPGGFRSVFLEIDAFHRDRRILVRRGRNRHEVAVSRMTHAPGKPKPRTATLSDWREVAMSLAPPSGQNRIPYHTLRAEK